MLAVEVLLVGTLIVIAYYSCMRKSMHLGKEMTRGTIGFAPAAMKGKPDKEKDKAASSCQYVCVGVPGIHEHRHRGRARVYSCLSYSAASASSSSPHEPPLASTIAIS